MTSRINLNLQGIDGARWCEVPVRDLVIAGWTGRDHAAVEMHIRELAELGVAPPSRTPIFYRVAASLLTTADAVDVIGTDSTGEVEFVLLNHDGEWWVGVGSDHTDRKAEAVGVTLSKQLCPKPLAPKLWSFDDVEPHWDELILRSYAVSGAERALYQEGLVSAMRHPRDLVGLYCESTETEFAVRHGDVLRHLAGAKWNSLGQYVRYRVGRPCSQTQDHSQLRLPRIAD